DPVSSQCFRCAPATLIQCRDKSFTVFDLFQLTLLHLIHSSVIERNIFKQPSYLYCSMNERTEHKEVFVFRSNLVQSIWIKVYKISVDIHSNMIHNQLQTLKVFNYFIREENNEILKSDQLCSTHYGLFNFNPKGKSYWGRTVS